MCGGPGKETEELDTLSDYATPFTGVQRPVLASKPSFLFYPSFLRQPFFFLFLGQCDFERGWNLARKTNQPVLGKYSPSTFS
jgi:hypothetical protein